VYLAYLYGSAAVKPERFGLSIFKIHLQNIWHEKKWIVLNCFLPSKSVNQITTCNHGNLNVILQRRTSFRWKGNNWKGVCRLKLKAELAMPCKSLTTLMTAALHRSLSWKNVTVHIYFTSGLEYFLSLNTISLTKMLPLKLKHFQ